MSILGNSNRNRWCCFCKYWYNPTNNGIVIRKGTKDMFDIDKSTRCTCRKSGLTTSACSACPYFVSKF